MLNNYLLFLILFIVSFVSFSQGTTIYSPSQYNGVTPFPGEPCASEYLENELLKDPAYAARRASLETQIQNYIQQQSASRSGGRGVVYTIPVVFHVMHSGEALGDSTNISLAQAQSAIAALNRDFRRTSADGNIANSGPLGVDAEIEFCLAQSDPNGFATDGVTRHDMSSNQDYLDSGVYHTASLWRSDASMKALIQWDPLEYLNVWVVNKIRNLKNIYSPGGFSGGVIGYATFPAGTPAMDGVVILSASCGNDPLSTNNYNLWSATVDGRVLTHEVGHYLYLYHTFQGGLACGPSGASCGLTGDLCCDTPPTPVGAGNNCTSPVCATANKENYMDYQNGACASDFTPNQVARMRAVLGSTPPWGRNDLVNTNNCVLPPSIDLKLDTIFVPIDTICSTTFTPEIIVCNNSVSDSTTSFDIKYKVDGGAEANYTWTGNLQAGNCDTFFLPSVTTTNGVHIFTARIDSGTLNGGDNDIDPSNNSKANNFTVGGINVAVLQTITECDSFVSPSGKVWKTSGSYNDTLQNVFGCDSLLSYSLTINPTIITNITLSGCDSVFSPSGKVYKSSGIYSDTISALPCDSIFNVTVTINHASIGDSVAFEWARNLGGTTIDRSYSITKDNEGNIYVLGYFEGTVDFDPGVGVMNQTSSGGTDIFMTKFNSQGVLIWAKKIGGTLQDIGFSISSDDKGNLYTTGYFSGTVDFDPGIAVTNLVSNGGFDIFVAKYDNSGAFLWAKGMGTTTNDFANSVTTDGNGNVYAIGYFEGTGDFDPGIGVSNLTSAGLYDVFITKLNSTGGFLWSKSIGGTLHDRGYSIISDNFGNIYTAGFFTGTADFDPGIGTLNLTSTGQQDIFIAKYNTNGNIVWAKGIGGTSTDRANSITLDNYGNIYSTGDFSGTVDFDPGIGVSNLVASGNGDIFISKLNIDGNFIWAKKLGGTLSEIGTSITTDYKGDVYSTGYFEGTVDFDPSLSQKNLTSGGFRDIFINKLDSLGAFIWAKNIGNSFGDYGEGIVVDNNGNVFTTGYFGSTVDFNPDSGIYNLTVNGMEDAFIHKLSQEILTKDSVCSSYTSPSGKVWTATGIYYDSLTNSNGCDSILKFDLVVLSTPIDTLTDTVCRTTNWRGSTITTSGTYRDTTVSGTVCDSIFILILKVDTAVPFVIDSTICFGDSILQLNGTVIKTSGIYYDTTARISNSSTCDSIIQYNVTFLAVNDTIIFDTICSGQTYTRPGGGNTTIAGIYNDTLTSVASCDSIIITNLAITSSFSMTQAISACDSFVSALMRVYTITGTYRDTLITSAGCDSIIITNLTVSNTTSSTQTLAPCDSLISPSGKKWTTTGTYFDTINNTNGCDSLMTFNLTINSSVINNLPPVSACDSAQVFGVWYYTSQLISDTAVAGAASGCDSITNTNLSIDTSTWSITTIAVCDSLVTGSGKVIKITGFHRDTMPNYKGCDSLVEYYLTVNLTTYSNIVTAMCDSFITPSGKVFKTSGTYKDTLVKPTGCDSVISIYVLIDTPSFVVIDTTICHTDSIILSNGTSINTTGTYFDTILGTSGSYVLYSEDFEGSTHGFTLNTTDLSSITPGGSDNAWIVNNSYAGGSVFGTPIPTTPSQNPAITGSATSKYLHVHNRRTTTFSFGTITNTNYIDGNITLLGGQNGMVFTKMTNDISTAGMDYVAFEMYYLCRGSWGRLYYSTNSGTTWNRVGGNFNNKGTHWTPVSVVDPAFANQSTIRFAFGFNNTDGGVGSSPGFAVDEITVRGVSKDSAICDSITQINLTVTPIFRDTITDTICDSLVWRGMTITTSGTYSDTVLSACDSVFVLNLLVNTSKRTIFNTNLCPGDSISLLSGIVIKTSGIYYDTSSTSTCDSIITFNVTTLAANDTILFDTICANDTYTLPNGGSHSGTGIYRDTLVSSAGCDSTITLNLLVKDTSSSIISIAGCDSVISPSGKVWKTSGNYTDTIMNMAGCDSLISITATISVITRIQQLDTACDSLAWRGNVYRVSGTFRDSVSGSGCDTIYELTLLINNSSFRSITIVACDSFMLPSGTTVYSSGTYNDTLITTGGCDSIISSVVTIGTASSSTLTPIECTSYTSPSGKVFTATGSFSDTINNASGCDSLITINLTVSPSSSITLLANGCDNFILPGGGTATSSGTYRDTLVAANSCDSIVVTNLILGQSTRDSNTYSLCAGQTVSVGVNTYGATGIFRDTLATVLGCDSIIITNLTINPLTPASITSISDMCENATPIRLAATPFGGKWGGSGIDTTTGLFDPSIAGAGTHTITYTAPGPCGISDSVVVTVFSSPTITAIVLDDECDLGVGAIDVTLTGGTAPITFTWSNGILTEDQIGLKEGTYTLNVVDGNGCTDDKSFNLVNLTSDTCDYNIFVPNIFSPNGDGENDVFQVEGAGIQTVELIVYNRWGTLVFQSSTRDDGWDGTYQSKPANPDVFVYYVNGAFVDGKTFNQKGTVTLIRR